MQKNILIVIIGGVAVIGAVTAAGYYLGNNVGKPKNTALNTSPSPSAEPTEVPLLSPLPTISPTASPSLLPTAPPQKATVKSAATYMPIATTASTGSNSVNAKDVEDVSIRFVDIPSKVNSGESFNVSWYISGPAGKTGAYTKISTSRKVGTSNGASSSYSSSETSQSFGQFNLPQKFVSGMTFSGDSGSIEVTASAEIDGKLYTITRSIELNG